MDLKRSNRERLIRAIKKASPDELEISAQSIKCSGLIKSMVTHLGENARQIEVSDDQTAPFLFC